jgi:hypothetical protein
MANIERFDSDSKDSRVSVLTGKSAITLSVSGVPEEQFKDLCREVQMSEVQMSEGQMSEGQMSEGKKTIGSIIRGAIDKYTKEVLRDPKFQDEMGRLAVLLEKYSQPDNQDCTE